MCAVSHSPQHSDRTLSRWITSYLHPPAHRTQYLLMSKRMPSLLAPVLFNKEPRVTSGCTSKYSLLVSLIDLNFPANFSKKDLLVTIMTEYTNVNILLKTLLQSYQMEDGGTETFNCLLPFYGDIQIFRQSTTVLLCLCTALWSVCTVFNKDVKATYLGGNKVAEEQN